MGDCIIIMENINEKVYGITSYYFVHISCFYVLKQVIFCEKHDLKNFL